MCYSERLRNKENAGPKINAAEPEDFVKVFSSRNRCTDFSPLSLQFDTGVVRTKAAADPRVRAITFATNYFILAPVSVLGSRNTLGCCVRNPLSPDPQA